MSRIEENYPPIMLDALKAIIDYSNAGLAHAAGSSEHEPDTAALFLGMPHGSISDAGPHQDDDRPEPLVYFDVKGRRRFTVPAGLLILRAFTAFGGSPFIDTDKREGGPRDGVEFHYVQLLNGLQFQRILAGAAAGERIKFIGDHHDLHPWNLRVTRGPGKYAARALAVTEALRLHAASTSRHAIDAEAYGALLNASLVLFDLRHGHHFGRALNSEAA